MESCANTIRFNLSHSDGRTLIAVSKDREVGVDLQKSRIDRNVTALAARFFALQEQVDIMSAWSSAKHWTFFLHMVGEGSGVEGVRDRTDVPH